MWRPVPGSLRDRLAALLALATVIGLSLAFAFHKDLRFLMPGPLSSAHGAIENCRSCHTKSGGGKLSWLHGLVAGDRMADSKACLTCHKMSDTAFNAHGASTTALAESTERLTKIAAQTPAPQSARAQNVVAPARDVITRGLFCSTCHQEHQGVNFKLNKISNEQCRSCHVVKFDSFDGHHPKFENYPFQRRSRIVYDHAGHFDKHYPELKKKDPAKRIPDTCASCHNSGDDKRVMGVAPFERTCSGCHLDQIIGKERATGPKGIAFLTVPGLDLQTLKAKNAPIGEWPDGSDAALTPFMKVMIARNERGLGLLKTVDGLNLQDLANASDRQIKAVTELAWEVKALFHALIKGKASDVLGDLNVGGGAKLSASLVADLTASIPRDVVVSAQQEWLPNLAAEMAKPRGSASLEGLSSSNASQAAPKPNPRTPGPDQVAPGTADAAHQKPDGAKKSHSDAELPPAMRAGIKFAENAAKSEAAAGDTSDKGNADGGEELSIDDHGATIKGRMPLPSGTPRATRNKKKAGPEGSDKKDRPPSTRADPAKEALKTSTQPEAAPAKTDAANDSATGAKEAPPSGGPAQDTTADQSDDLLVLTPDELREMKAGPASAEKTARPEDGGADSAGAASKGVAANGPSGADANTPAASPGTPNTATAAPQARAAPVVSIGSDVDPESWAEYGGWYRQDFAIFYRPTGHKDKFAYSWLFLTGPQAPKDDKSPAAAVFAALTHKDAQGSCTKCHSIDDLPGKGRLVNFSPISIESKKGSFTKFVHEPHFGIMENRGCLTCHSLAKDRPYLKTYEQGNPQNAVSNFAEVKKDLCQSCHTSSMARQDCLLCHNYHVNGAITPIMNTRLPIQ